METIHLREDFIKLGQALKAAGLVESGVEAKLVIQDGQVKVNGQVEYQRGKKLVAGDIVEFDIRNEEKGLAAVNIVPVLTLRMMKQKAEKEHLHLEVAPADGSGNTNWMIVDGNNFIVAGEKGMSLEELDKYFAE